MKFKLPGSGFVFEGEALEKYKSVRNKWIRLAVIGTVFPLFVTAVTSWYNGKIDLLNLFGQGEIILSLFSLNMPMLFDLFDIKKSSNKQLEKAFYFCMLVVFLQLVFYCLIKMDASQVHQLKGLLTSIPFIFMSWSCCLYSIKAMSKYTDEKENNE